MCLSVAHVLKLVSPPFTEWRDHAGAQGVGALTVRLPDFQVTRWVHLRLYVSLSCSRSDVEGELSPLAAGICSHLCPTLGFWGRHSRHFVREAPITPGSLV